VYENRFGFSDDPLDGFRDLRSDLELYGQVFLAGSDTELRDTLERATRNPRPRGIRAIL